tara:strand:+ start:233 stop:460 length:228 start_codon:yes stop_codon:yes gene_type:complete
MYEFKKVEEKNRLRKCLFIAVITILSAQAMTVLKHYFTSNLAFQEALQILFEPESLNIYAGAITGALFAIYVLRL